MDQLNRTFIRTFYRLAQPSSSFVYRKSHGQPGNRKAWIKNKGPLGITPDSFYAPHHGTLSKEEVAYCRR